MRLLTNSWSPVGHFKNDANSGIWIIEVKATNEMRSIFEVNVSSFILHLVWVG